MYGSVRSQLMQVSVQKSTRTTRPRSPAGSSGSELSQAVPAPNEGMCTRPKRAVREGLLRRRARTFVLSGGRSHPWESLVRSPRGDDGGRRRLAGHPGGGVALALAERLPPQQRVRQPFEPVAVAAQG